MELVRRPLWGKAHRQRRQLGRGGRQRTHETPLKVISAPSSAERLTWDLFLKARVIKGKASLSLNTPGGPASSGSICEGQRAHTGNSVIIKGPVGPSGLGTDLYQDRQQD